MVAQAASGVPAPDRRCAGVGIALAGAVAAAMRSETYRIPLVVSGRTYAISALIVVIAAAVSGLLVRRRLNRLDLMAVLKTRE